MRGTENLSPEVRAELQERANYLRMNGRPIGSFYTEVGKEFMTNGRAWPKVLEDEALGTTTVPATFEGLVAIVCSWDSLLLDEELQTLRTVIGVLYPAGLIQQEKTRKRRAEAKAEEEHMQEHHPEEWEKSQGWMA